jgi:hypothetical protein
MHARPRWKVDGCEAASYVPRTAIVHPSPHACIGSGVGSSTSRLPQVPSTPAGRVAALELNQRHLVVSSVAVWSRPCGVLSGRGEVDGGGGGAAELLGQRVAGSVAVAITPSASWDHGANPPNGFAIREIRREPAGGGDQSRQSTAGERRERISLRSHLLVRPR